MTFQKPAAVLFPLLAFLAAGTIFAMGAQGEKAETHASRPSIDSAVFTLKHADVNEVAKVLDTFRKTLGGTVEPNAALKVIAVSGPPALVTACRAAIQKLDVPSPPAKDILLTFYVLGASKHNRSPAETPTALEGVVRQVRNLAGFKSFRLLDTKTIRVRDGMERGDLTGTLPSLGSDMETLPYTISFYHVRKVESGSKGYISIGKVELSGFSTVHSGQSISTAHAYLQSGVEFTEGQKVVIGTTGLRGARESILLVVTAQDAD